MPVREIKTTIAVDGEQEYKRALNDAKTSLRNMGTQLTLAQAEFKKTGDAQKLMSDRAKTLKNEIAQQNEIVKSLDGAMKDAAKQYGEGSKEAEKWEAELNRAKATMANMERELQNNERGLDRNGKAFDSASAAAGDFSDAVNNIGHGVSFEMITSGIGRITSGFESALKKAAQLGQEMWNMMRDAASWADDEITLAKIYGVTPEELQRMQHAAKMVDTDVDTLIKSRKKLSNAMTDKVKDDQKQAEYNANKKKTQAPKEDTDLQEAFKALRVPVIDQTTGKMRDMENVFWDAGQAIMAMEGKIDQNSVAMKLFGKSWDELKPMFSAGRQAYSEALAEATVVPQENLEKLSALQDELDRLDTQFQALKMNVLSELAPAFETLAKALTDLMAEFNAYLETDEGKAMMESLSESIRTFFSELTKVDVSDVMSTVSDALGKVTDAFNWISEHKKDIVSSIKAIGWAFLGLKAVELAANLGKIVWGLKQFLPNGSKGTPDAPTEPTVTPSGGGTGTTVAAAGTPWYRKAATGLRNALPAAGQTAAFMLPLALGIDGIVHDQQILAEWLKKGQEETARTEAFTAAHRGNEAFDEWDALNAYLKMPDRQEGTGKMEGFVDEYFKWFNDDLQNAVLDKMAENMTDDEFDAFHEAMLGLRNGDQTYSEADIEARFAPLNKAFEIIQQMMEPGGGLDAGVNAGVYSTPAQAPGRGDYLTSQDIQEFGKVPEEMANQVGRKLNGLRVEMDRVTVARMVAPEVSRMIATEI